MATEFIEAQSGANITFYTTVTDLNGNLLAGLTASDLSARYIRPLDTSPTEITLSDLASPDSAHTDGGFAEIDATSMPGLYRLDVPDALAASGKSYAILTIGGSGLQRIYGKIELDPMPSVIRSAVSDTGATTSDFNTNLTESTDGQFIDAFLLFVTGVNSGAVEKITGYDGTNKTLTTGAFPSAPADGDEFVIVNR